MSQAAFLFEAPSALPGASAARPLPAPRRHARPLGVDDVGFEIGWDFAHHRLTPPVAHLHADNPVRQGWSAARAVFGSRTLRPGAAVRQWLALRLVAWQHGQAFEGVQVTPHFIAQLQADSCPVTGASLLAGPGTDGGHAGEAGITQIGEAGIAHVGEAGITHVGEASIAHAGDAGITRLNRQAAYAAGNLALLSARARQAAAGRGWQDALDQATLAEEHGQALHEGLTSTQWRRLAVLMSFATPLDHARAAELPLLVLPPNRVRVLNPVQALQVMLTLQFCQAGYARRLVALAALMPTSEIRQAFQVFMHTLLARRLAAGPVLEGGAMRHAMEQAWTDALVQRRWQRLALRLTAAECEQLLQRAVRRGLLGASQRWQPLEAATEGWALDRAGRAVVAQPSAAGRQSSAISATEGVVSANPMSH